MPRNEPRDHHYVPQFFLRNFSVDLEKRKVTTVTKHGPLAVWAKRSIDRFGFERDLYVHLRNGVPLSVEGAINKHIETPISKSDTWQKIADGQTDALDRTDKPILYALIRHLEARTPHYFATTMELARLAASPDSDIPFTDEERAQYTFLRANPDRARATFNVKAASLEWTEDSFTGAGLSIFRSPIPLCSSSTPVLAITAPMHPALHLPLPGMSPYQLILTLNRTTIACLVLGNFDDAFANIQITADIARQFNRYFVGQFTHFPYVRHLITGRNDIAVDMHWARYDLVEETERKITFRRRG